jgi:hypothetical protein
MFARAGKNHGKTVSIAVTADTNRILPDNEPRAYQLGDTLILYYGNTVLHNCTVAVNRVAIVIVYLTAK